MEDPKKQMNEYLEKIIFRYLYIHSLNQQVRLIEEWESQGRKEALNIGSHFFGLVMYSFRRTIILELFKLASNREEKSILDWLNKAKENAGALDPSKHNRNSDDRRSRIPLEADEYINLIKNHLHKLKRHSSTIQSLKGRRDKLIAHIDRAIFNNPQKLIKKYPLSGLDINALMDTISEILCEHHILLLHADVRIEISASSDVDQILKYVRAFARVRKDKKVTHDYGIRVYKYLGDDYEESTS